MYCTEGYVPNLHTEDMDEVIIVLLNEQVTTLKTSPCQVREMLFVV